MATNLLPHPLNLGWPYGLLWHETVLEEAWKLLLLLLEPQITLWKGCYLLLERSLTWPGHFRPDASL